MAYTVCRPSNVVHTCITTRLFSRRKFDMIPPVGWPEEKRISTYLPNREELLFLTVFAFPENVLSQGIYK